MIEQSVLPCARRGCSRPGEFSRWGSGGWFCRNHLELPAEGTCYIRSIRPDWGTPGLRQASWCVDGVITCERAA